MILGVLFLLLAIQLTRIVYNFLFITQWKYLIIKFFRRIIIINDV